jgi:hypothetical protein
MMPVKYENWWSKLLFSKSFERQFVIPVPPPGILRAGLGLLEKTVFNRNYSKIRIDRPIFIVGMARSGTSVLYDLLCAHEHAAYVTNAVNSFPNAIVAMEWLRRKLRLNIRGERFLKDSVISDFGSPSEPALFWGKWIGRDVHSLYWPEKRLKDFSDARIREIHTDVRKMLFAFGADPSGRGPSRRFVCKYPVFHTELRMLNDLFPGAYFVHIVRDGRQVSNSLLKLNRLLNEQIRKIDHPELESLVPYPRLASLPGLIARYGVDDIRTAAHVWQDSIDQVRSVSGELSNYVEIRYEDLLDDPAQQILSLMNRLALPRPAPENSAFWEYVNKVGVIHHKNSYGQFDVVESIAGRTLQNLGYMKPQPARLPAPMQSLRTSWDMDQGLV